MLTWKGFWGEISAKRFLIGDEKSIILAQIAKIRDCPSEQLFLQNEEELFRLTHDLWVRPGQSNHPVLFWDYYLRCWKSCSFRWVFAYRKNLPTMGANDTQAAESTFRAIKHYIKQEFGGRNPSMDQVIRVLPKVIDKRSTERNQRIQTIRFMIRHPENEVL